MTNYSVTFEIDLETAEGREQAERLESWLAKERYDCPDNVVAGQFNGIMEDLRDSLTRAEKP